MSHTEAAPEMAAQNVRDTLRLVGIDADVQVLPVPRSAHSTAEAVIDIEASDPNSVGAISRVIGPRLTWRDGIIPGSFRVTARSGRYIVAVWCTVDESAPVAIPDGAK